MTTTTKAILIDENALLRAQVHQLESDLAQASTVLQWVDDALEDIPVSEFAESFPVVQKTLVTMHQWNVLITTIERIQERFPDLCVCDDCLQMNRTDLIAN